MNLIQISRILLDYRWLLISVGVLISSTIWLNTKNEQKVYTTEATVYTGIATGFNIETGANARFDLFATNAKFDNLINIIKNRTTHEEVGMRLLAHHLVSDASGEESFTHLNKIIPDSIRSKLVDISSVDITFRNIEDFKNNSDTNVIYKLINSGDRFYSVSQISTVFVKRIQSSDLISLRYSTNHAGICQQTLSILITVFLNKYKSIKEDQTSSVVKYFEEELRSAKEELTKAEQALLHFREKNKIINYYEQTKFIAEKKEELDSEYQKEIMALASAKAALSEIESRMTIKTNLSLQNDKILEKRKRISSLASKITLAELHNEGDLREILQLREEASQLKMEMTDDIQNLHAIGRSASGLPMSIILEQWLQNVLNVEETNARASVILQRKEEFYKKYDTFAPLGSEKNRIEREINLAEEKYLKHVESLNQSKLKQQNVESMASVKTIDEPFYPLSPKKSIRKILVTLGFVIGVILTAGIFILLEFIDTTIKTPDRVVNYTKLGLLGVYPKVIEERKTDIDFPYITNRLIELMIQRIKLSIIKIKKEENEPYLILISSTRRQEGKSFITEYLVEKIQNAGNKVMIIKPFNEEDKDIDLESLKKIGNDSFQDKLKQWLGIEALVNVISNSQKKLDEFEDPIKSNETFVYEINNDFFDVNSIKALLQNPYVSTAGYDYIFLILPPLLRSEFPAEIVSKAHLSMLIVRANRNWNKADDEALHLFQNSLNHKSKVILNGTRVDILDSMIGEIPKKRSWRRKLAKKIITFDFWSQRGI